MGKQWKETGTLVPAPVVRGYKKSRQKSWKGMCRNTRTHIQKRSPRNFSCYKTAIRKALGRLGITRKKRRYIAGNRTRRRWLLIRKKSQTSHWNRSLMWTKPGSTHICIENMDMLPEGRRSSRRWNILVRWTADCLSFSFNGSFSPHFRQRCDRGG